MKIPQLKKKLEIKNYHGYEIKDEYSWIHQDNILEVLKDSSKLNSDVRKYLEAENEYTKFHLKDTNDLQKKLFAEIKGRIKLDDESLKFKDKVYEYWTKTKKENNYLIKLRRKIGSPDIEEYWNGDFEKKKLNAEYFGIGDLAVSNNDELLGYSLDLKGSEYYTIYIRQISDNKLVTKKIEETSGNIIFSLDDKYIFYSKLDANHRPRKIFRHKLGSSTKDDELIFEEKDESFTASIGLSSDEKFFLISSSDHVTSETHYFSADQKKPAPKLLIKREEEITYGIDSWDGYFYMHTNKNAEDFKICRCKKNNLNKWKDFVPARNGTLIGGFSILKEWMIRFEIRNALPKLFVRNLKTNEEEELIFSDEKIYMPGCNLVQKDRNTDFVYLSYASPKTPGRSYLYNLKTKKKKIVKKQEIPSGHNPDDYMVERLECDSYDGVKIPITITRHKKTKLDGSAHVLLYSYGAYGNSIGSGFSSACLSLINRDIIWVTAHVRGGLELGMHHWRNGKMLKKKNTFEDYIAAARFIINKKYSSKGKIIGMGGRAGGLLIGAVVNQTPELFLGMIMAVPFVDSLTTNLNHSLPLTKGEFLEFGNAKENKEHFKYILSYAPYNNIKKMSYPHLLITTSLSDNRVLFDESAKFTAKLRDYKTDNNLLLLKTEMNAGHGGKSGRDSAIEEMALDYAFALKISGKLNT